MGLFGNQLANVVEWEEYRDDVIFWNGLTGRLRREAGLLSVRDRMPYLCIMVRLKAYLQTKEALT